MFSKVWNYICSFSNKKQNLVTVAPPTAHSTIPPTNSKKTNARPSVYLLAYNQIQNGHTFADVDYQVAGPSPSHHLPSLVNQNPSNQQQEIMDQIRELNNRIEGMNISHRQLRSATYKTPHYNPERPPTATKQQTTDLNQHNYRKDYMRDINDHLQLKYSREREEFPFITLQDYSRVRSIWTDKKKNHTEIRKTNLQSVQRLNYKAMGGIDHGAWLNDDIINIYLQLLQKTLVQNSEFKILNSYFATTTMTKPQNMILRYTKKKNITKDSTILMPINNRNHWYFAKFEDNHLVIYDSIRHQPNYYLDNKIFKDALKFGKSVFGEEPALVVSQPYPQQNNQYDCGVFMLLGIRDSLRRKEWSFHQGDMRYKRVQIALEVLNCKLALNE